MTWTAFRSSRIYDLLMALPLILWFGATAVKLRPALMALGAALVRGDVTWHGGLLFLALFASATFNLLLVYLLIVRTPPVRRADGLLPRLCGFAGTFLGVGILHLPLEPIDTGWIIVSDIFLIVGFTASVLVLSRLGKAFAIMPEARTLVTSGAYAHVRHPLYAVEMLCLIGNVILFEQPWSSLIATAVVALLLARAHFEEQVLAQTYQEYVDYRARTWRFVPGIY